MRVTSGNRIPPTCCWEVRSGKSDRTILFHVDVDCRVLCHGDDCCMHGDVQAITYLEEMLSEKHVYKRWATLGFESSDDRHAVFLREC